MMWRYESMKVVEAVIGKEVIDESGDQVGIVEDINWNFEDNRIESIILKEAGISAKIGLGDEKIVSYEMIKTIGDKVLIKGMLLAKK